MKRSCHRRGRCFALRLGLRLPLLQAKQLSHAFFVVYNLTAGRVKENFNKMKKVTLTAFAVGLCMTANVLAQVPSYVPTNGLVGWWPFNGNANDESGFGNNGTVNGATLTTDRFGNANNAYSFDGVNDFIQIQTQSQIDQNSNYTWSFWFNSVSSDFNGTFIGSHTYFFKLGHDFSGLFYKDEQGNQTNSFYIQQHFNVLPPANTWHNLVIRKTSNIIELFLNGTSIGTTTTYGFANFSPSFLTKFGNQYADYYNGKLDDIGIWNRDLTQQEITDLYNGTLGISNLSENSISIYPNPSNNHITIDAGDLTTMNGYSIKIEDAQGQQVFQNAVNQQQFYIDITTWGGNGLYFVRIIDPQGNTVDIRKIVLQ